MAFCPKCHSETKPGARFCGICGEMLSTPSYSSHAEPVTASYTAAPVRPVAPATPVAPVYHETSHRPVWQLATNRGMLKMILLGLITLGIYPMIISAYMTEDINIIACAHDGKRTTHPTAAAFLTLITLGIYNFVWNHKLCNRIGAELNRRRISYHFRASTFWLWNILGILIVVGPLVYLHKYCKAMNLLAADYNERG